MRVAPGAMPASSAAVDSPSVMDAGRLAGQRERRRLGEPVVQRQHDRSPCVGDDDRGRARWRSRRRRCVEKPQIGIELPSTDRRAGLGLEVARDDLRVGCGRRRDGAAGRVGVSLPTGGRAGAAAGAVSRATDGAAAAADVGHGGRRDGIRSRAGDAPRAVASAAATAEAPRRCRRLGREVIGVVLSSPGNRRAGRCGRPSSCRRRLRRSWSPAGARGCGPRGSTRRTRCSTVMVDGERALRAEVGALAEPRVGADEELVGDDGQLGGDRVRRRVPVLDVAPVHQRVDRLARACTSRSYLRYDRSWPVGPCERLAVLVHDPLVTAVRVEGVAHASRR